MKTALQTQDPEEPEPVVVVGIARGHLLQTASLHFAGTHVHLPLSEAVALAIRGVVVLPESIALSPEQRRAAARQAFLDLEREREAAGWTPEHWTKSRAIARQYQRIADALKKEKG